MSDIDFIEAASLIEAFGCALPGPYGYERSLKFTVSGVETRRFLITFPSVALELGANLNVLLRRLKIPASDSVVNDLVNGKDIIHLGLEGGNDPVCKLYAEDAKLMRSLWQGDFTHMSIGELPPVHRAIKWSFSGGDTVESRYDWLPCGNLEQLESRVSQVVPSLWPLIRELLNGIQCPISDLHLLKVSEPSVGRLSLDINLYDANLTIKHLIEVVRASGVGAGSASTFGVCAKTLEALSEESLGHVAAGIGRSGESFFTVYYGAEERGGF